MKKIVILFVSLAFIAICMFCSSSCGDLSNTHDKDTIVIIEKRYSRSQHFEYMVCYMKVKDKRSNFFVNIHIDGHDITSLFINADWERLDGIMVNPQKTFNITYQQELKFLDNVMERLDKEYGISSTLLSCGIKMECFGDASVLFSMDFVHGRNWFEQYKDNVTHCRICNDIDKILHKYQCGFAWDNIDLESKPYTIGRKEFLRHNIVTAENVPSEIICSFVRFHVRNRRTASHIMRELPFYKNLP